MKAQKGDRLACEGTRVGDHRRTGVIVALHHPDGSPPYTVRWQDDDHETIVFPGTDAHLEPVGHPGDQIPTATA